MPEVESLSDFNLTELKTRAKDAGIKGYNKMSKEELINELDNLDKEDKTKVEKEEKKEEVKED